MLSPQPGLQKRRMSGPPNTWSVELKWEYAYVVDDVIALDFPYAQRHDVAPDRGGVVAQVLI